MKAISAKKHNPVVIWSKDVKRWLVQLSSGEPFICDQLVVIHSNSRHYYNRNGQVKMKQSRSHGGLVRTVDHKTALILPVDYL